MMHHNQLNLIPGPYEHYKKKSNGDPIVYIVESVVTHTKVEGTWKRLQDPLVIYRNLEPAYDTINGNKTMVVKNFARPLSEFKGDVHLSNGETVKRFKPI